MLKPLFLFAFLFTVLVSHSNAEESPDTSTEVALPKCRCLCRTSPFLIRFTRRRCRRQAGLCRLSRCTKRGRRGVRCCIIFKLVPDEDAVDSTGDAGDASGAIAAPYPALGGSCGGSNVVNNFFSALALSDGTSLTRVKISFCVAARDIGKRMFDAVIDDINRRFNAESVRTVDDARTIIREEAVSADAFALGYYNPV